LAVCGGTVACGAGYAVGLEPLWIETRALEIVVPRLPAALDGYVVVQLSDLHAGGGVARSQLERAVAIANAHSPSLVAVTGDLVDEAHDEQARAQVVEVLAGLEATDLVVAVAGNHDTGALHEGRPTDVDSLGALERALGGAGIAFLENRTITLHGGRLRVAGFGDLWSGRFDPRVLTPGPCTIALSHNPDTAVSLAGKNADLILAGHTHGGQVDLPLFGPPWVPLKDKRFLKGHFELGQSQLYVNRGIGWTHRIRFRSRPEVTVLTLRASANGLA